MEYKYYSIVLLMTSCTSAAPALLALGTNETMVEYSDVFGNASAIVYSQSPYISDKSGGGGGIPLEAGTMKHVQIFLNHRYLHMHSDGIINGSLEYKSNETLWKRIATNDSGIIIQSVAYCSYLCMNECGFVYSIDVPNYDCIFTEIFKENNYEFIVKKIEKRYAYLALNIEGKPRRTVLRRREPVGDLLENTSCMITVWEGKNITDDICTDIITTKLSYRPKKTCRNPLKKRPTTNDIPLLVSSDYEDDGLATIMEEPIEERATVIEGVNPKNFYVPHDIDDLSIKLLPNSTTATTPTVPLNNGTTVVVEEFIDSMLRMPKASETMSTDSMSGRNVFMKFENNLYVNKCIPV